MKIRKRLRRRLAGIPAWKWLLALLGLVGLRVYGEALLELLLELLA